MLREYEFIYLFIYLFILYLLGIGRVKVLLLKVIEK